MLDSFRLRIIPLLAGFLCLALPAFVQSPSAADPAAVSSNGEAKPPAQTPGSAKDAPNRSLATPRDPKKAKQAYALGRKAEKAGNWQAAYEAYAEAAKWEPDNRDYVVRRDIARSRRIQEHVDTAERDAVSGRLDDAKKELQAGIALDPTDSVLRERLSQFEEPSLAKVNVKQLLEEPAGEIHLQFQPGTRSFDYSGDTQGAYQELGRQFGVEVAFDVDLQSRPTRLRVADVDFPTAARVLGAMTGTFWRPLTKRLFFVAADTQEKRRAYDVSVARTILLPASATPQEMTELLRLVRDIVGVTRTQLDTSSRTITLRASPSAIALASHLVEELEQPRGEVVLEMEILSVDRNYARQLGVIPPQSAQMFTLNRQQINQAQQSVSGLVNVITQLFGQPNSLAGLTSSQIAALLSSGRLNLSTLIPPLLAFGGGGSTFLATLPGAAAHFSEALSLVRSGQRVLLRAQDGQPATFFVGDRFPVTLAQFSASITSGASVPIVNSSNFSNKQFNTGKGPVFVVTGKFAANNTSDRNDLAVANETDDTVSILLNDGTGSFKAAPGNPPATGKQPVAIATGSFNPNNAKDQTDLAVANFNCTGTPLVCGPGSLSILLANGDGTFTPAPGTPPATGKGPVALATGKFNSKNANDHTDIAVVNQVDNTLTILLGNGNGTFTPTATSPIPVGRNPSSIAVGDFNGDGFPDLAITNENDNTATILLGKGDGTFTPAPGSPLATGNSPIFVAVADFNGDTFLDLAVANHADNTISFFPGNGAGTFGTRSDFATGKGPTSIAPGDYNADGRIDLAVTNQTDNTVSILLNLGTGLGTGLFGPPFSLTVGANPVSVTTSDFNGDNLPDVAIANQGSNTVSVILNSTSLAGNLTALQQTGTPFPGSEYVDLGVKVKATPRVHPDDEVSLHMEFEIRALSGQNVNGIPILSNRTVDQMVRVRDGETSILAGLLQPQETHTLNGTPGLGNIEGLGYVFGNRNTQKEDTELLILITPHLVRFAPHSEKSFYAGHEPGQGSTNLGPGNAGNAPPAPQP
jgi:Bacterial type II and III secretion system protein/FG-GAP-like repeat